MSSKLLTYRSDPDFEEQPPFMKFRLFYDGSLKSARGEDYQDRRREHKHDIRMEFHHQLKHLWKIAPAIKDLQGGYDILGIPRPEGQNKLIDQPLFRDVLAEQYIIAGQKFVPLVVEAVGLNCSIDVLMLRQDRPGGVLKPRDIDNRLKVLFDALRVPRNATEFTPAPEGNEPIFVLLEDDSLVSNVRVETDDLLADPINGDDSFVRLILTIDVRPYRTTMFNLSYAGE